MKSMRKKRILGPFIFLAVFAAGSAVVMLLWNWIIPAVIGWSAVSFWQAAGLLLLCKVLFGGFSKGGPMMGGMHFHHKHPRMGFMHDQRARIHEAVKDMSPEERRDYIRKHMFGGAPADCCHGDK